MSDKKVVIVGGGNAGLSAAYTLHKAGVPFVLLEASNRVGGRVIHRQYKDIIYNDGAFYTEPQWKTTFDYLEEFGLLDKVYEPDKKVYGMWLGDKVAYFEDTGNLFQSLLSLKGMPKKLLLQGAKFVPALLMNMSKIDQEAAQTGDFDSLSDVAKLSVREWCKSIGCPEIADKALGPMLGMMTLARTTDVSAAHPIALMKLMSGMDNIEGGLCTINENIYDRIKDSVRLNTPVQEIVIEDNEIKGVKLVDGEFIEADQVICGTDAVDALKLMPNLPDTIKEPLGTCTYCKTWHYVFYYEDDLVPDGFLALWIPESTDAKITTIFAVAQKEEWYAEGEEKIHKFDGTATQVHTFTAGWYDDYYMPMTDEERHAAVIAEIEKFYPGFGEKAELIASNRMERAINLEPPGQYEAITDMKKNHLDDVKGLYLGGEYMFLIACTEGAWATGKQAGEKLLADIGK